MIDHHTIHLFKTPGCSRCPGIQKKLDEADLKFEVIDITEPENEDWYEVLTANGFKQVPLIFTSLHIAGAQRLGSDNSGWIFPANDKSVGLFLEQIRRDLEEDLWS